MYVEMEVECNNKIPNRSNLLQVTRLHDTGSVTGSILCDEDPGRGPWGVEKPGGE